MTVEDHRHCKICGDILYEERSHEGGKFPTVCKDCQAANPAAEHTQIPKGK